MDMSKWLESGTIKTRETVVEGFENLPKAYELLFTGGNIGLARYYSRFLALQIKADLAGKPLQVYSKTPE